jgi:Uma2 family endonuclease
MTAEPAAHHWHRPPVGGFTVDDLLTLPDLPPHTELIDGSLVFVSPQRAFCTLVLRLLENGLVNAAPPEFRVRREMAIVIDSKNCPEPDISVLAADAVRGMRRTKYSASDVLLAVEAVSPDSEARDRDTKAHKYANAGIEHYWLAELTDDDRVRVSVFRLDHESREYGLTSVHDDRIVLDVPFPIDIDLTAIDQL